MNLIQQSNTTSINIYIAMQRFTTAFYIHIPEHPQRHRVLQKGILDRTQHHKLATFYGVGQHASSFSQPPNTADVMVTYNARKCMG